MSKTERSFRTTADCDSCINSPAICSWEPDGKGGVSLLELHCNYRDILETVSDAKFRELEAEAQALLDEEGAP